MGAPTEKDLIDWIEENEAEIRFEDDMWVVRVPGTVGDFLGEDLREAIEAAIEGF